MSYDGKCMPYCIGNILVHPSRRLGGGRDHLAGAREKAGTARVGEPARPGANQATGPPGINGHRRKGPGGAAPLYRGPRWRDEARRGRAVSAGASFGSSAASPYILANAPTRGRSAPRCTRPLTRAAILTVEAEVRTALHSGGEQHRATGQHSPSTAQSSARPH